MTGDFKYANGSGKYAGLEFLLETAYGCEKLHGLMHQVYE